MNIDDFHFYVGKTLMYCQTIEHDIKWIYAGMRQGDDVTIVRLSNPFG